MATKQYKVTLTDGVVAFLRGEDTRGRLSEGIDRLVQRVHTGATTVPALSRTTSKPKTLDLSDEDDEDPMAKYLNHPDNPSHNGNTANKLARLAREAEAVARAAHDKPRREFKSRIRHAIEHGAHERIAGYNTDYADMIPKAERKAITDALLMDLDVLAEKTRQEKLWTEHLAEQAIHERNKAAGMDQAALTADYQHRHGIIPDNPVQTLRLSTKALKGMNLFGTPLTMTDEQIKETNEYWESRPLVELLDEE